MKTAEAIIDEIQSEVSMGPFEYLDYKDCLRVMKSYASEVAKEVLKRAAENAEIVETTSYAKTRDIISRRYKDNTHSMPGIIHVIKIDRSSILNTEYQDLLK